MKKSHLIGAMCAASLVFSTSSNAALVDNGGGLIYDDVLDITWAQPTTTTMTWDDANTYAAGLTLGGVTGWRQAYIDVTAGAGPFTGTPVDCSTATELACRNNELGYMYWQNLNGGGGNILSSGDPDLALFSPSLTNGGYFSGTEYDTDDAWGMRFDDGSMANGQTSSNSNKATPRLAWAVHAGNVSAVPVPAAVWLFGSGLLGLIGIARRKKA